MQVYIKEIEKKVDLIDPISTIIVENSYLYRSIYFNSDEELIISNGLNELLPKQILIVPNCYDLDLNSRKNLTLLYKRFNNLVGEKDELNLLEIEKLTLSLLDSLIIQQDLDVDFEPNIDPLLLFKLLNLKFTTCSPENYVEYVVNYFKTVCNFLGIKVFITFNLSKNFNDDEFKIIQYELSLLDLKIIDFCLEKENYLSFSKLIIDNDYCII